MSKLPPAGYNETQALRFIQYILSTTSSEKGIERTNDYSYSFNIGGGIKACLSFGQKNQFQIVKTDEQNKVINFVGSDETEHESIDRNSENFDHMMSEVIIGYFEHNKISEEEQERIINGQHLVDYRPLAGGGKNHCNIL